MIIPKLAMNKTVLTHRVTKVLVNKVSLFFTGSQRYLPSHCEAVSS
jgi:hypothetical protein